MICFSRHCFAADSFVQAVQNIYNRDLREFSVWEIEPRGGIEAKTLEQPEWKISSIVRHLLMSSEFEVIFEVSQTLCSKRQLGFF